MKRGTSTPAGHATVHGACAYGPEQSRQRSASIRAASAASGGRSSGKLSRTATERACLQRACEASACSLIGAQRVTRFDSVAERRHSRSTSEVEDTMKSIMLATDG